MLQPFPSFRWDKLARLLQVEIRQRKNGSCSLICRIESRWRAGGGLHHVEEFPERFVKSHEEARNAAIEVARTFRIPEDCIIWSSEFPAVE
jgi:hypothetical protein